MAPMPTNSTTSLESDRLRHRWIQTIFVAAVLLILLCASITVLIVVVRQRQRKIDDADETFPPASTHVSPSANGGPPKAVTAIDTTERPETYARPGTTSVPTTESTSSSSSSHPPPTESTTTEYVAPSSRLIFCFYSADERDRLPGFGIRQIPSKYCNAIVYCCAVGELQHVNEDIGVFNVFINSTNPAARRYIGIGGPDADYDYFSERLPSPESRFQFSRSITSFLLAHNMNGGVAIYLPHPERLKNARKLEPFIAELQLRFDPLGLLVVTVLPKDPFSMVKFFGGKAFSTGSHIVKITHDLIISPSRAVCPSPLSWKVASTQLQAIEGHCRYMKLLYPDDWSSVEATTAYSYSLRGYRFLLNSPDNISVGVSADFVGKVAYVDLCRAMASSGWQSMHDNVSDCLVAYMGQDWMSSPGPLTGSQFLEGVGGMVGVAIFDLDGDDFTGECGKPYPLTRALYEHVSFHSQRLARVA